MSEIRGLALVPRRGGWEQLQRNFAGIIDFQRFVPSLADLREEFEAGRINFARTEIVVVADIMAQGVSTPLNQEGTVAATHLVQAIGNFICPALAAVTPVPVLILQTGFAEAQLLRDDVEAFLAFTRDAERARAAVDNHLVIIEPSLMAVHEAAKSLLPNYPQGVTPTTLLVLDSAASGGVSTDGAPVVTCTSAKGGVGKTTTALLLAFASSYIAHKQGKRMNVVVVELDLASAQIGHIVGAEPLHQTILDYVNMSVPTERALAENLDEVTVLNRSGAPILPAGSLKILHGPYDGGDDKNIKSHHIHEVLTLLRNSPEVDLIVVDTAPELREDDRIRAALEQSNLVLYITQDSKASMGLMAQNLEHMVKNYHLDPDRVKIVINNSNRTIDDQTLLSDVRALGGGIAPLAVVPRSNAIHVASGAGGDGEIFHALFDPNDPDVAFAYQSLCAAVGNFTEAESNKSQGGADSGAKTAAKKKGLFGIGGAK